MSKSGDASYVHSNVLFVQVRLRCNIGTQRKAKSTWLLEVIIPYDKLKPGPTINKNTVSSTARNLAHARVKNVETNGWEKR